MTVTGRHRVGIPTDDFDHMRHVFGDVLGLEVSGPDPQARRP
jgi:hypothetical protein